MSKKGMSEDMYNHIVNNIHFLKDINIEDGTVTTVKGYHGSIDNGYLRVKLNKRSVLVHQIIAVKLFGEKCIGLQVNHIDGNKLNNKPINLEVITLAENIRHGYDNGLYDKSIESFKERRKEFVGERVSNSKLTEDDVRYIRSNNDSHASLARKFSVDPKVIRAVRKFQTWKHVI
jgi:hypothetical protein